jgi:glucokinase
MSILTIDFGGTRTRAAWFSRAADGSPVLINRREALTRVDEGQQAVIERLIALGRAVIPSSEHPLAVGIAAPGPHDARTGVIHHAYTLPGWEDVPLGALLAEAFSAPVHMQNDGNLGAIAEYAHGAGRGCSPMIYMTISTGIGGGVMLDGRLFTGWSGLAAEPGHVLVMGEDGHYTRLEAVASGTAMGERAARLLAMSDAPSMLRGLEHIDGAAVGRAALAGDPLAESVVEDAGRHLGYGLVTLLHLFSPECVVVGGSVSRLGDRLFAPARAVIDRLVLDRRFVPPNFIRPALLGEDVCLIGAGVAAEGR